ncbi:restriction endonuclease subunit S [Citrobacter portucalensis]|uniref:restriction endonuclease subunit S n=1 Tax=Citrobacter portucalensis TaxID=1639133 RepID=UPI00226B5D65|nr:restriction endonuclease subunit S [Citrobacter portucalensis]MCX9022919.1 restriction endonuclease subunit S [Citrobacter portucalensis]
MSFEWKQVRLGDFIDSCLGKMLDQKKNKGAFHPYLGNSNVRWGEFDFSNLAEMKFEDTEHERYSLKKGDLVVCEGGEPGRCAIWEDEIPNMKIQKALHRIRTLPGLVAEYLYYWFLLAGKTGSLEPYFTGTTIKHLTGRSLADLTITLPPVKHQEKCALVLGSLDRKITHNKKINQTLEQMAQALFKSWFVDFEPVKAKMAALEAGGSQEGATLAAMTAISGKEADALVVFEREHPEKYAELKATAELFPSAMQESELGEIPEGWLVKPLGDSLEIKRGGSPRPIKDFIRPTGYPWVKIADATASTSPFLFKTSEFIKEEGLKKTVYLRKGDLILSNSATPGLPKFLQLDACIHDGWLYFPKISNYTDTYLYFLFLKIRRELVAKGNGSVFTNLKTDILREHLAVLPEYKIVNRFSVLALSYLDAIKANELTINSLSCLRDTLLPKLLSGEITLPEAEQVVSEAENV